MTTTPAVDDFAYIRERLAELEGDKRAAEAPKAWPSYAGVEQPTEPGGEIWGHYSAPDQDCALVSPVILCREFVRHLSNEFGPINFSPEPQSFINGCKQGHVDFRLNPQEMILPTEKLSREYLLPIAKTFADYLKFNKAVTTFALYLPDHGKRAGLHSANCSHGGMAVRCLVQEPEYNLYLDEMNDKYLVRFDVLYKSAADCA